MSVIQTSAALMEHSEAADTGGIISLFPTQRFIIDFLFEKGHILYEPLVAVRYSLLWTAVSAEKLDLVSPDAAKIILYSVFNPFCFLYFL